jgi:hypothetical protein
MIIIKTIKISVFSLLVLVPSLAFSQYISNITSPDKSKPVVTDKSDLQFALSEMITASDMEKHLRLIASDSLEGRETGKPGIDKARDYIISQLKEYGVGVFPLTKLVEQPVALTFYGWEDADIFVNRVRYKHLWDFLAFPEMNTDLFNVTDTEVVFLGYGIDDAKYSDYKKAKVKDKIIMINRGEPIREDGTSYLTGSKNASSWSDEDMKRKLEVAKNKGVKLVLIIDNDIKKMLDKNRWKLMGNNLELGDTKDKPMSTANHAYISTTVAKALIGTNESKILNARKKLAKGKPAMVKLKTDLIGTNLMRKTSLLQGTNIIATIEGETKPDEHVIVSAHYDHLGKRGDEVFNGADDNGSGTTALLSLAKVGMTAFKQNKRSARSITYLWVCGEEKGLLGSLYYSENPVYPLKNTVADVNVDMIGRLDDKYKDNSDYIYVIGSDRLSTDLHKINEEMNQKYTQITLDYTYNAEEEPNRYYYRSDHYNFAKNGIPSIFFFSGVHDDYHKTTDDVSKINFDKMAKIGKLIFHNIWAIANRPERLKVDGVVK